ncbi:MAG: RNA polymerase sigma-I factor [Eubacteriales bacterium]
MNSKDNFVERIKKAKKDEVVLEELLIEYKPFIKKVLSKVVGHFVDESDDLFSIGLLAFKDALIGYDDKKGKFISYAELNIRSRSIDYLRKEKRIYDREIYEEYDDNEQHYEEPSRQIKKSIDNYSIEQVNEIRKLEIKEFAIELNKYDMTLEDLTKASPKQDKLRKLYISMAKYIMEHKMLKTELFNNKKLSIKELEEVFKVNRKKIERGRKYIIAISLIMDADYDMLKEYIKWGE